jgi:uncharacterized membrane protein YeaQ/YmgE (transglycosylase-associated protein family)
MVAVNEVYFHSPLLENIMIWTLFIGAIIGLLARAIKPGADPLGWILTILIGIGGSYLGSRIYSGGGMISFAVSIGCAIALLFVYELIRKKK